MARILARLQLLRGLLAPIAAASTFLYCSVLTVQGFSALLLPRRLFLRLSAILQLVTFGLFLGVYFLRALISNPAVMSPQNQRVLAWSPSSGSSRFSISSMAHSRRRSPGSPRAWIGLGPPSSEPPPPCSLLLADYEEDRRRTGPGAGSRRLALGAALGSPLQTALVLQLSVARAHRQHRILLAFYLSVVCAIALALAHDELSALAVRFLYFSNF